MVPEFLRKQYPDEMTVVAEAKTGESAIELAHATRPDVAIIDIKLPGISGLEVTRRLSRQLPQTRVIVLTALDVLTTAPSSRPSASDANRSTRTNAS